VLLLKDHSAEPESSTTLRRSTAKKQTKSVGDYCLICLFWALVIVHLWIYKFFLLILPAPIVCIVVKKLGLSCSLFVELLILCRQLVAHLANFSQNHATSTLQLSVISRSFIHHMKWSRSHFRPDLYSNVCEEMCAWCCCLVKSWIHG